MMRRYGLSLRMLENGAAGAARAGRPAPSASRHMRKRPGRLPVELLVDLIQFAAGRAAYETFSTDSTRHRLNRHILIDYNGNAGGQTAGKDDAPEGKRRVADARERRALISPDGVAPASMVTDRDAADSAAFAKPCRQSAKMGRRRSGGLYLLGRLLGDRSRGQGSIL